MIVTAANVQVELLCQPNCCLCEWDQLGKVNEIGNLSQVQESSQKKLLTCPVD